MAGLQHVLMEKVMAFLWDFIVLMMIVIILHAVKMKRLKDLT